MQPLSNQCTLADIVKTDANWVKSFDERLPLLVDPSAVDARDFGGKSTEAELVRVTSAHTKEEEEGKYRCKECNKLFSAQKFVVKHIATKHAHFVGDALDDVDYLNSYILDPTRFTRDVDQAFIQEQEKAAAAAAAQQQHNGHRSNGRQLADRIDRPTPSKRRRDDRYASGSSSSSAPPPPPPAGAALDPRARRGARDYADLDGAPQGAADVTELPY